MTALKVKPPFVVGPMTPLKDCSWPEVLVAERPLTTPKRAVVPGSSRPEADFAYSQTRGRRLAKRMAKLGSRWDYLCILADCNAGAPVKTE